MSYAKFPYDPNWGGYANGYLRDSCSPQYTSNTRSSNDSKVMDSIKDLYDITSAANNKIEELEEIISKLNSKVEELEEVVKYHPKTGTEYLIAQSDFDAMKDAVNMQPSPISQEPVTKSLKDDVHTDEGSQSCDI